MFVPKWIYFWILISTALICFDSFYLIHRPQTMRYGPYQYTFEPYQLYKFFDPLRENLNDKYIALQPYFNLFEAGSLCISAIISLLPSRKSKILGAFLILIFSCFVWWKTIMYLFYDWNHITFSLKQLYTIGLAFYSPIFLWVFLPYYCIKGIIDKFTLHILNDQQKKDK